MYDRSPDPNHLLPALEIIYTFVEEWHRSLAGLACGKGCSTCCTDQVTVTEGEARRILRSGQTASFSLPPLAPSSRLAPLQTTNEFALACLRQIDPKEPQYPARPGNCPFLSDSKECSVYPDRPLMCRLFISKSLCSDNGEAVLPERIFLTQVILQQLVEHLSHGLLWGNLLTMLWSKGNHSGDFSQELRRCRKIPAFLISPEEKRLLEDELQPLFSRLREGGWLPAKFSLDFPAADAPSIVP